MTAAQKKNIERFKKAAAEAKKLRKKNPKLTQTEAIKEAFKILYKTGKVASVKKTATKKPARKKTTAKSYHKDTKSHNVRINVVSGVKIGALPIGFHGTIWGVKFKIINQFDIYGKVNSIVEDTETGAKIVVYDGISSTDNLIDNFLNYILKNRTANYSYNDKELKDLKNRIKTLSVQMQKEVKNYNFGIKKTKKIKPLNISSKKITTKKSKTKKHTHWATVKEHKRRVNGIGSVTHWTDELLRTQKVIAFRTGMLDANVNMYKYGGYPAIEKKQIKKNIVTLKKQISDLKKHLTSVKKHIK